MRVIIVGAGEVGYHVADRLAKEQHDVVIVDVAPQRLDYVESHLDVAVLEGSGASPAVLERAGIKEAGLLLAVTSVDEVNLVTCMTAPSRPGLVKVARVSNPDFYAERTSFQPGTFGVDLLINPERELALEAFRLLQSTAASDVVVFAGGAVQLLGLWVTEEAPIANRQLASIGAGEGGRVTCPDCGHDNIDGLDACEHCGQDLRSIDVPQPKGGLQRRIMETPLRELNPKQAITVGPRVPVSKVIARSCRIAR